MRPGLALVAIAALALAACDQTVYLYPDAGAAPGGKGGSGTGGFAGSSSGSDAGGTDQHCSGTPTYVNYTADTPQLAVVLDRSSSMSQFFPNSGDTHLSAAIHSLYSQVVTYTKTFSQRTIHFSFVDFPDPGMSGCASTSECCASAFVSVNTSNFDMATACESPSAPCIVSSSRPTDAALIKADQALGSSGFTGPRYVLLISDGDPQGCASDDCSLAQHDGAGLLATDHAALEVVAIQGSGSTPSCLQDLAMTANGTTRSPFYATPSDAQALGGAITTAVQSTLCSVTLTAPPTSSSSLQVFVGNGSTSVPNSSYDGWTYDSMSGRLRLHGNTCDLYNQTGGSLFVTAGCAQGHPGPGGNP